MSIHHHRGGDWLEETFIGAEIFRFLLSFKGLLFIGLVAIVISTWNSGSRPAEKLNGEITDQETHLPLDSVYVTLQDTLGNTVNTAMTDDRGLFSFQVQEGLGYRLEIEKAGYHSRSINDTRDMNSASSVLLRISLRQQE